MIGRDEDDMVDEKPRLKSPPRYIPGTKLPPPPTAGPSRSTIASFVTDGRRGPATAGTVTSGMEYGNAVVHNNFKVSLSELYLDPRWVVLTQVPCPAAHGHECQLATKSVPRHENGPSGCDCYPRD